MQQRVWCCARSRWGRPDRILTILTPDLGVISASARGSLRMKSPSCSVPRACSATLKFCLSSGRSHFFVDAAQIKKVFHGVSATVEGMALASYMAEIAMELSPTPAEGEADAQLRLLLNCLYLIGEQPLPMVRHAESRSTNCAAHVARLGYMPDLLVCARAAANTKGESFTWIQCAGNAAVRRRVPSKAAPYARTWTQGRLYAHAPYLSGRSRIKKLFGVQDFTR